MEGGEKIRLYPLWCLCPKIPSSQNLPVVESTVILKPTIGSGGLAHDIWTVFSSIILKFKSEGGSTARERVDISYIFQCHKTVNLINKELYWAKLTKIVFA